MLQLKTFLHVVESFIMINHLKLRNRALFWLLMILSIILYGVGFLRTGGGKLF